MKIPAIFKNKVLYYVVLAFSVLNVLGYVSMKAWECLALFSLTAYIVNMQVNNVTVGLLAGIFVANFIFSCGRVKEGMVDKELQTTDDDFEQAKKAIERAEKKTKETMTQCAEGEEMIGDECIAIAEDAVVESYINLYDIIEQAKKTAKNVTNIAMRK
tara:strand:+ start:173 stop:646 length:474 start_codon:yes stop_codon:yes gene_type:complete